MDQVLSHLPRQHDEKLLVGFETGDDAGVYLISEHQALVQTVDFFTPIVDDPFVFGQVSAANSLSDVYAMGGKPLTSLTIVGFPRTGLDFAILEQILAGGLNKMEEAGCTVVGGHSLGDEEIKFGYAVTGLIDPQRVYRNIGACVGDRLVLTKPLGTGVISTAVKNQAAREEYVEASIRWMTLLNRTASEVLEAYEPHAVTDVTGFGLLGHARQMAQRSDATLEFDHTKVPAIPGALECIRAKMIPGGLVNNQRFLEQLVDFSAGVPEDFQQLLFDPQTSGGLLIASSPQETDRLLDDMSGRGIPAVEIGVVVEKRERPLRVI